MNYGVIAYEAAKDRWQWWARYVGEADARQSFAYRCIDSDRVLLVRMIEPPLVDFHKCSDECGCISAVLGSLNMEESCATQE